MPDPTLIEEYIPSTQASITTAINRIGSTTKWVTLEIAPGNYDLTKSGQFSVQQEYAFLLDGVSRLRIRAKGGGQVTFTIPTSNSVSNPCTGFMLNNASHIEFNGIRFVGTDQASVASNIRPAVYLRGATTNIRFIDCDFENSSPVAVIGNQFQRGVLLRGCTITNACRAVNLPDFSRIEGCDFQNDEMIVTDQDEDNGERSHAIYVFGRGQGTIVTGNHFKNITKACLKWKGNSATMERKSMVVFSGNTVDTAAQGIEIGSLTEVVHEHLHVHDNSFRNVQLPIKGLCTTTGTIHDNTITCDWESPFDSHTGIVVLMGGPTDQSAIASATAVHVHHNIIRNKSGFVAELTVSGIPTAGQTLTFAGTVHTFVSGAAASATDISLTSATTALVAQRIADTIRGRAGYTFPAKNAAIDQPSDVQIEASDVTPQRVVFSCPETFTISTNASNLSVTQEPTDFRHLMSVGIETSLVHGYKQDHNTFNNCVSAWVVKGCTEPYIGYETVIGWTNPGGAENAPWACQTVSNSKPHWDTCTFIRNRMTQDTAARRWDMNDGWPVIEDQIGVDSYAATKVKSFLMGKYGHQIPVGDGVAHTIIWMGRFGPSLLGGTAGTPGVTIGIYDFVQNLPFTWKDGDTITLTTPGGTPYVATFTRVVGTASSANTFNTKAEFIAWVNAQTAGNFLASDTDALSYGYVTIKYAVAGVATVGTTGNNATIVVSTQSKLNGIVLTPNFKGGRATADRTVFWSPRAEVHRPLFVDVDNTAANTQLGASRIFAASADTVSGACYQIQHAAASDTTPQLKAHVA